MSLLAKKRLRVQATKMKFGSEAEKSEYPMG
jgi:hypothetical protein